MAGEVNSRPLGELCSFINRGSSPAYADKGGVLVINQRCIRNHRVDRSFARRTDEQRKPISIDRWLQRNDIVVNSTGVGTLGRVAQVQALPERATVDSHVTIVRPDPMKVDAAFLGYSLRYREAEIENLAEGSTGQTELSRRNLAALEVSLPDIRIQQAIGEIGRALDEKIDLNRQMAATLEDMARALFQSWFVDFDPVHAKDEARDTGLPADIAALFPNSFDYEGLPTGWTSASPERFVEINPTTRINRAAEAPYIDMAALPTQGPRITSVVFRPVGSGSKFKNGDTLLARITPCLENGKTALVDCLADDEVAWGSTEFIVMRPKESVPAPLPYLIARDASFRAHVIASMSGTSGRQRAPAEAVGRWNMAVPTDAVISAWGEAVLPMFDRIQASSLEAENLTDLRDTLLPKLLSGELQLPDAETVIVAA